MKRINIRLKIKIRLRLINLILNNNMINLIKLNIKILLKENYFLLYLLNFKFIFD